MNRNKDKTNSVEKDRIRSEIDAQVEAFLEAGGKIDVLSGNIGERRSARGAVWRTPDEIPGLSQ